MSGSNAVYPFYKGWLLNGVTPNAGGKLYTYKSGTVIPLTTYSDPALTIPNANPVILNSVGEAAVFLLNQPYKFVQNDASNALINTFDPVISVGGSGSGSGGGTTLALINNDLRSLTGPVDLQFASVSGRNTVEDGYGGDFFYNATNNLADDGYDIIKPTAVSGAGRWVRINTAGFGDIIPLDASPFNPVQNSPQYSINQTFSNRTVVKSPIYVQSGTFLDEPIAQYIRAKATVLITGAGDLLGLKLSPNKISQIGSSQLRIDNISGGILLAPGGYNGTSKGLLLKDNPFSPNTEKDAFLDGSVISQGPLAKFILSNPAAAANNQNWGMELNTSTLNFRTDADDYSAGVTWLSAVRSGTTVTTIAAKATISTTITTPAAFITEAVIGGTVTLKIQNTSTTGGTGTSAGLWIFLNDSSIGTPFVRYETTNSGTVYAGGSGSNFVIGSSQLLSTVATQYLSISSAAMVFYGNLNSQSGTSAGDVVTQVSNTNIASLTAGAAFKSVVGGTGSGDPYARFTVSGVTDWTIGLDNSDSDAFVIATSATLGTTNRLRIDASTGEVTIGGSLAVTGNAGVGGTANVTNGFRVISTALTGIDQYGVVSLPTFNSAATGNGNAFYGKVITSASAFTMVSGITMYIDSASKGAGSTITNLYGLKIENQTAGTNNWAIKTGTGNVDFGGPVTLTGGLTSSAGGGYEKGTFTATLTGCTVAPTKTVTYVRVGDFVLLSMGSLNATSNATTCTLTGIPASLQPTTTQDFIIPDIEDASVEHPGYARVTSGSGTITLGFYSAAGVPGTTFTASGSKGLVLGMQLAYFLN